MAHLYSAGAARRPGRNVLAVQVHQHAPESSDAGFDLELTGIVQPPLDASRTAAQITLTTSAAFLNRAPEHSGSPGGPSAVTAPPVQSGGLLHYTLPVTAPRRFFRMRQTGD